MINDFNAVLFVPCSVKMPQRWDEVKLEIVRPGRVDPHGACANLIPLDDHKAFLLSQGKYLYSMFQELAEFPPLDLVPDLLLMCCVLNNRHWS